MQTQQIEVKTWENGLTLAVERMPSVGSAAFSILVPGGSNYDPREKRGTATALSELLMRGAGDRDSRQLSSALDDLGVQRHNGAGSSHVSFGGATLSDSIHDALRIFADVIRRPWIPDDHFAAVRSGIEQSLLSVEDEPRQKLMVELWQRTFDAPWGLSSDGSLECLPNLTIDGVQGHYEQCFRPNGTIIGVAGNVDIAQLQATIDELFGDWEPRPEPTFETTPHGPSIDAIEHDSAQTHIGLAYPSVPYRDENYYAAWAAVSVLSGGMSSRLFTEVREKRGLCYAISASLNTLPHEARVVCYAGTENDRAQETLDVTLHEIHRLGQGITDEELNCCKARAKSALIMQQESAMSRSGSIARDWYHLQRIVTLSEVRSKIDALDVSHVLDFVHQHPPRDLTILTIGPKPLEVPSEIS